MITKEEYFNQLNKHLIAVDFDDTIIKHTSKGHILDKRAKKYLTKLHNKGYRLIFWSARVDDFYEKAYNELKEYNLEFIEKDSDTLIHGNSGKLVCSYYIDDKSSYGKINWRKTYNYITKNII